MPSFLKGWVKLNNAVYSTSTKMKFVSMKIILNICIEIHMTNMGKFLLFKNNEKNNTKRLKWGFTNTALIWMLINLFKIKKII